MNYGQTVNKFTQVLLNPQIGWKQHSFSDLTFSQVVKQLLSICLGAMFVARLIGKTLTYLPITDFYIIFLYALVFLVVDLLFFILLSFSINSLLPYYKVNKSKQKVSILILLSLAPFYISMIAVNLFPSLFFLAVVSLYSFYVLYWGLVRFLKIPKTEVSIFFIVSVILVIGIYLILNFVLIYPFFDFIL